MQMTWVMNVCFLEDCCAATDPKNHLAAVDMLKKQGGVFRSVSSSDKLMEALSSD
jgi:hypothetical protein